MVNVRSLVVVALVVLQVSRPCASRSTPEVSVSVYTTQPTPPGDSATGLDVYQQIANNIAERITSPIYRFLGIRNNRTEDAPLTKRPWQKIELLDEPEEVTKSAKPVDNDISDRSVEELSVEALKRIDRKPEKLILYSSYLPTTSNFKRNDSLTDVNLDDDDETFGFDEVEPQTRGGPFVLVLEWFGSLVQLVSGVFDAIFKPSKPNTSNDNDNNNDN